jgi:hypothetical protein
MQPDLSIGTLLAAVWKPEVINDNIIGKDLATAETLTAGTKKLFVNRIPFAHNVKDRHPDILRLSPLWRVFVAAGARAFLAGAIGLAPHDPVVQTLCVPVVSWLSLLIRSEIECVRRSSA